MGRQLGIASVAFLLIACAFAVADDCYGVLPEKAYAMLFDDPNTYIVGVRSPAEYYWVGHPETNLADDPATRDYHMPINKSFARDVAADSPVNSPVRSPGCVAPRGSSPA